MCQGRPHHYFSLPFRLCSAKCLKTFRPDFTVHVVLLSWCKVDGLQPKLASGRSLPLVPVKTAGTGQCPHGSSVVSHPCIPGQTPLEGSPCLGSALCMAGETHRAMALWGHACFRAELLVFRLKTRRLEMIEGFEWRLNQ